MRKFILILSLFTICINAQSNSIVRYGNDLCAGETEFVQKRKVIVQETLESVLQRSLSGKEVPTVALVCSGGGLRAAISTMGFLSGIEKAGLLNAISYISCLSGSSWFVAPWLHSGLSVAEFKKKFSKQIAKNKPFKDFAIILKDHRLLPIMDLYALFLKKELLNNKQVLFSDLQQCIKDGSVPFPIFTSVSANKELPADFWYEFTPYECGASWLGLYVPIDQVHQTFHNGTAITNSPEKDISHYLAIFGSAFSANIMRIYKNIYFYLPTWIKKATLGLVNKFGHKQITTGIIPNFTYGMPESMLAGVKELKVVDAGIASNLPYFPVSGAQNHRKADIIIFLDASMHRNGAPQLMLTELYAREHGLPFPSINYTDIEKRAISVFESTDPETPTVVYMPIGKDQNLEYPSAIDDLNLKNKVYRSANFSYKKKQIKKLTALCEHNVVSNKHVLVDVIENTIDG